MVTIPLTPESAFSRAVFKLIRPHIPRERWPVESVRAVFQPGGDGLWLDAEFEGFPTAYAALASRLVRDARVELVLQSPAAWPAARVVRAKRWRDFCLYAFLPLMFAGPLMGALNEAAMKIALLLFCVDVVGLLALQVVLARRRARMQTARFIAQIPAPGFKISLVARGEEPRGASIPEI